MSDYYNKCGGCRWWAEMNRTPAVAHIQSECKRRAPHPAPLHTTDGKRYFPITYGTDGCGDYQPAGKEVYRADYAEQLGPWITLGY